jgi:hypothetical protein
LISRVEPGPEKGAAGKLGFGNKFADGFGRGEADPDRPALALFLS